MDKDLENKLKKPLEYNISDVFVPLKLLRHLPEIFKIDDPVIRYYETAINALITSAQIIMYNNLYELVK